MKPAEGGASERSEKGGCSKIPSVGECSRRPAEGGSSETPAGGGNSKNFTERGCSKRSAEGAKLHITGVYAVLMAWIAILWIRGYDGAVLQNKRDTGDVMYNHAGGRYPSHQTAAMVEDMMPGILRMRFQEWDPGEMDTYSEMYLPEVSMAKGTCSRRMRSLGSDACTRSTRWCGTLDSKPTWERLPE